MLKFRILRDKARIHSILSQLEESKNCFEEAMQLISEAEKDTSLKYAKLLFFRGLANKRVSSNAAIEIFEESIVLFYQILKSDMNYFIC
jgi:tetratricopeptide (TPR) repeat protein